MNGEMFRIAFLSFLQYILWIFPRLLSTGHSVTITLHLLLWSFLIEWLPVVNLVLAQLQKESDFIAASQPFP